MAREQSESREAGELVSISVGFYQY